MFSSAMTKIALRKAGLGAAQRDLNSMLEAPRPNIDGTTPSALPAFLTTNPFKSIVYPPTLKAWMTPTPTSHPIASDPVIGSKAPDSDLLGFPAADGRPSVICFLRGGGCPFAEKTFLQVRKLANKRLDVHFIAVLHSSPTHTEKWVQDLGGSWNVTIINDEIRDAYAAWGLGLCTIWSVFGPQTWMNQRKLGTEEGIWARHVVDKSKQLEESRLKAARPDKKRKIDKSQKGEVSNQGMVDIQLEEQNVEGGAGNRWQTSGSWAIDRKGIVRWGGKANSADDVPDLEQGLEALGMS